MAAELKSWKTLVGLLIAGVALQAPRVWAAGEILVNPQELAEAKSMIDQMPPSTEKDEMLTQFDTFEKDVQDGKVDDADFVRDLEQVMTESPGGGGEETGTVGDIANGEVGQANENAGLELGAANEAVGPELEQSSTAENTADSVLDNSAQNEVSEEETG